MKQISCPTCGHDITVAAESRKVSYYLCQKCGGKVPYKKVGLFKRLFGQNKETSGFPAKSNFSQADSDSKAAKEDQRMILDTNPDGTLAEGIYIETFGGVASPIINIGSKLPVSNCQIFSTAQDNQHTIGLHVLAGKNASVSSCRSLGRFNFKDFPRAPKGVPQIEARFAVDHIGNFSLRIRDLATRRELQIGKPSESIGKEQIETEYQGDGVGILFDWEAIGGEGTKAWQVFCESCDPKNLVENTVLMTDVESEACKIEIKALTNRQHAFCVALPDARSEQVNYVHNAVLSNAAKFLLPEKPFVSPALVGPWGPPIGRISFKGEFTLYDGDFLWVLLRAAKAKWNCSVSTNELNRFLRAVKSCSPVADNEMAIYAHAIGAHRLDQALANFRSDYSRSLAHWSEDERPARQRECEEFIARLKRAIGRSVESEGKQAEKTGHDRTPYSKPTQSRPPSEQYCAKCFKKVEKGHIVCPYCGYGRFA